LGGPFTEATLVKSKCSFAPKKPKAPEMLPTTGVAVPSQTPVTNSSNA
jgi:hypothetical protein